MTTSYSLFFANRFILFFGTFLVGVIVGFSILLMLEPAHAGASAAGVSPRLPNVPNIQNIRGRLSSSTPVITIPPATVSVIPTATTTGQKKFDLSPIKSGAVPPSQYGPFIKCTLLSGVGWPIPTFSIECGTATTTPPPPPPPPPPTATTTGALIVFKQVSGTTTPSSNFTLHVMNASTTATTSIDVAGSPQLGSATGTVYLLSAGQYVVSETGTTTGFSAAFSGGCDASGRVQVNSAATSTCTITNTFDSGQGGGEDGTQDTGGGEGPPSGGGSLPTNTGGGTSGGSSGGGGGGGSSSGPLVLGTTTPDYVGGGIGMPSTGAGGDAALTLLTLTVSLITMLGGIFVAFRMRRT